MIQYEKQHVLIAPVNRESPFNSASQRRHHSGRQRHGGLKSLFVRHKGHQGSKLFKGKDNAFHA